jgi:hypothetical protein
MVRNGIWRKFRLHGKKHFAFSRRRYEDDCLLGCCAPGLVDNVRRFGGAYCLHQREIMIKAVKSSDMSINIYQTRRRNIPKVSYIQKASNLYPDIRLITNKRHYILFQIYFFNKITVDLKTDVLQTHINSRRSKYRLPRHARCSMCLC